MQSSVGSFNEIVTLQFGNYSNFVCSHYWNLQENLFVYDDDKKRKPNQPLPDVIHDCLFREGVNYHQRAFTFTPRTVLVDCKENVNFLRSAYKPDEKSLKTDLTKKLNEKLEVYQADRNESSRFIKDLESQDHSDAESTSSRVISELDYDMDHEVKYWSDYLKMKFHDRTCLYIEPYLQNPSQPSANKSLESAEDNDFDDQETFGMFTDGLKASKDKDLEEKIYESLRHFGEECNCIQGFQLFMDSFNGFGGFSAYLMSLLGDEYPKKPILTFLPIPYFLKHSPTQTQLNRLMNMSLTLKNLLLDNKNNICLPLSLMNAPFSLNNQLDPIRLESVSYNYELNYHTSAILASLIDCLTTPFRQRTQIARMNDLLDLFDIHRYKLATLQSCFPFYFNEPYLLNYLQENDSLFKSSSWFSPYSNRTSMDDQLNLPGSFDICCRGIPDDLVKNPRDTFVFKPVEKAHSIFDYYFKETCPKSKSIAHSSITPLNASFPFPNLFANQLKSPERSKLMRFDRSQIPILTILQMNKSSTHLINLINQHINKTTVGTNFRKFMESSGSIESEDLTELIDFNTELVDSFEFE